MAYCGYADYLMVFMYVTMMMLVLIIIMLVMIWLSNLNMVVVSMKVFNHGVFADWELSITMWGLLFLILVLVISSSVMIFSCSYMNGLSVNTFLILYLSFVFSMSWLIVNSSFYWMMLGWDGLGVVSFLLIVYYMNVESINNGLFTLSQNRIGDLFFIFFILCLGSMTMGLNLVLKMGLMFLLVGACVKSAQFPFNSWLLAAMSAPTPISSLVHSSTLVVAGVYILLQFSYCFIDYLYVLKWLSLLTLVISSFGLLNEMDMKKLIAYSTMSHVALMMYFYSFMMFKIVYFHLNIHAMFKSMMFMCFGFVMLCSYHGQDKRLVSLLLLNPLLKIIYYFSCLCLAGLPFMSGFFSKDLMIEKMMEDNQQIFYIFMLLVFLSISVYYSLKLMNLINWGSVFNIFEKNYWGLISVVGMMMVSMLMINVYLSLMFSVSLEFLSSKWSVYMLMMVMGLMSLMTNLNYKLKVYNKAKNFFEIWAVDYYYLEKFMYWNIFLMMEYVNMFSNIKLIILMNWWVMIVTIVLF